MHRRHPQRAAGFTLVEAMVAISISMIVLVGMLAAFVWTLRRVSECQQSAWAQTEALQASQRMVSYLRNGSAVTNIDVNGDWVDVAMPPTNAVARFSYVNPSGAAGDGQMLFVANRALATGPTNVLALGLSRLPARHVFARSGTNALTVAFRVSKPGSSTNYAADIDVTARLRNR